ncbi:MAG: hypothetical protein ACP5UB_08420 [Candidatus Sumerlaeaceae bacterium]
MLRVEKLLVVAIVVALADFAVRIAGIGAMRHFPQDLEIVSHAQAQAPIIGVSLLPRYVITTNQNGNLIYVWEDQGKGYEAKTYYASPR